MWSAAFAKQAKFKLKQEPIRLLVGANCRPDCDERLDGFRLLSQARLNQGGEALPETQLRPGLGLELE